MSFLVSYSVVIQCAQKICTSLNLYYLNLCISKDFRKGFLFDKIELIFYKILTKSSISISKAKWTIIKIFEEKFLAIVYFVVLKVLSWYVILHRIIRYIIVIAMENFKLNLLILGRTVLISNSFPIIWLEFDSGIWLVAYDIPKQYIWNWSISYYVCQYSKPKVITN